MKKLFFNFANTLFKTSICVFCSLSLIGLSSCGDDDEEDSGTPPNSGLVSATVPSEGWSGSTANGICTYRSSSASDDDDFSGYYAFSFKDGKCTDAVFNVVCENEAMAKYLSQALNSGEWANDDDEDYSMSQLKSEQNPVLKQALCYSKAIKAVTRSVNVMSIACTQEGKIVYFKLEAVKGLDGESVKYVMKAWDTGLDMNSLPAKPVFGTWNEATGEYASNSIYAIPNTKIEIETGFSDADIVTKYKSTFTLPNAFWAEMIEESLREQADDFMELASIELEITRNDNVVVADLRNVETANTTKEYLVKMIIALDILNARPIGTALF